MLEGESDTAAAAFWRPKRSGDRRVFYGWWIVLAGAGIQMLQSALLGQAYGAYVVLLREQFGWSKTLLSGASALREAEHGLTGPFQGSLLDRFGPRNVGRVGVVLLAVGFMLFSQVESPLTFYAAFLVMSVGGSMMGYLTITFAVVHWFERRRSTAISLTSAGFALGGMAVPVIALALDTFGWRTTAFSSGVLVLAVGLPLTQILRHHPAELGLALDGGLAPVPELDEGTAPSRRADFTLSEALHHPSFWWISLGHASAMFVVSALGVHLISHLKEGLGYSLGQASAVVFLMTLLQLAGTVSGGLMGDKMSKQRLIVVCMIMHAISLLVLAHATSVSMVVGFAVIHGLAWGWRGPQMAAIRADYFGRSAFGKILGVSNTGILLGTISGPLVAGVAYDWTGDYRVSFYMLATIAALGTAFFMLARQPVFTSPRVAPPS